MRVSYFCSECKKAFDNISPLGLRPQPYVECPECKNPSKRLYKSIDIGEVVSDTIIEVSNHMIYGEPPGDFKKVL